MDQVDQIDQIDQMDQMDQIDQIDQMDQIDQIDHDLDHLEPTCSDETLMRDPRSTDPTQETCARSRRLYGSHPAT